MVNTEAIETKFVPGGDGLLVNEEVLDIPPTICQGTIEGEPHPERVPFTIPATVEYQRQSQIVAELNEATAEVAHQPYDTKKHPPRGDSPKISRDKYRQKLYCPTILYDGACPTLKTAMTRRTTRKYFSVRELEEARGGDPGARIPKKLRLKTEGPQIPKSRQSSKLRR